MKLCGNFPPKDRQTKKLNVTKENKEMYDYSVHQGAACEKKDRQRQRQNHPGRKGNIGRIQNYKVK